MKETVTINEIAQLIGKGKTFVRGQLKERDAPKNLPRLGVNPKRYDKQAVEKYFFSE